MSSDVWNLIEGCWRSDPHSQPSMEKVLEQMKEVGFGTL
jgi:hypothetical protein